MRRYLARPVPPDLLRRALALALWAPSPHHSAPWRFVLLHERERRERLARMMGARWRQDLEGDGVPEATIADRLAKSHERIVEAPAAVLFCIETAVLQRYSDSRRQQAELIMANQSLGAVIQNFMAAAHALGLASCWMCAPLFCPEVARDALDLPASVLPQALVTVGYAPAPANSGRRPPLESFLLGEA